MDEELRFKARMYCLELAGKMCALSMDRYSVESLADGYWNWLSKKDPAPTRVAAQVKTDDDIRF